MAIPCYHVMNPEECALLSNSRRVVTHLKNFSLTPGQDSSDVGSVNAHDLADLSCKLPNCVPHFNNTLRFTLISHDGYPNHLLSRRME